MKIEELFPQQSVTIQLQINSEQIDFPTTVLEIVPKQHGICVAPILKDGKVVSFRVDKALIHLIATFPDNKPHIFYNVAIETYKKNDNSFYYFISSSTPSLQFNRREAFRCFIGLSSMIQIGLEKRSVDGILRDISSTGFSFVPDDNKYELDTGSSVYIALTDFIDENHQKFSFYLTGIVVRKQELENNKTIDGCRLNNRIPGLEGYIMLKERLRLSKSRNIR